uniref:Uncharacterized protein n=1 Tax=Arundo donax TaxID=35708 RepID=A0A0A9GYG4_ARUDO
MSNRFHRRKKTVINLECTSMMLDNKHLLRVQYFPLNKETCGA